MVSSRHIELIEDLPLNGVDKWYVLLACNGQKKASWLITKSDVWRDGDESREVPQARIMHIQATLQKLGLPSFPSESNDSWTAAARKENADAPMIQRLCDILSPTPTKVWMSYLMQ